MTARPGCGKQAKQASLSSRPARRNEAWSASVTFTAEGPTRLPASGQTPRSVKLLPIPLSRRSGRSSKRFGLSLALSATAASLYPRPHPLVSTFGRAVRGKVIGEPLPHKLLRVKAGNLQPRSQDLPSLEEENDEGPLNFTTPPTPSSGP